MVSVAGQGSVSTCQALVCCEPEMRPRCSLARAGGSQEGGLIGVAELTTIVEGGRPVYHCALQEPAPRSPLHHHTLQLEVSMEEALIMHVPTCLLANQSVSTHAKMPYALQISKGAAGSETHIGMDRTDHAGKSGMRDSQGLLQDERLATDQVADKRCSVSASAARHNAW